MSDEAALLHAIYANPDDDTPRLVYADWLDEHDQPERAEFIRLQVESALRTDDWNARHALRTRARELLSQHQERWTIEAGIPTGSPYRTEFRRGFANEVIVSQGTTEHVTALNGAAEFRQLSLIQCILDTNAVRHIAALDLDALTIHDTAFPPAWLELLEPLPCGTVLDITPSGEPFAPHVWRDFQSRRIGQFTFLSPTERLMEARRWHRGSAERSKYTLDLRATRKAACLEDVKACDTEMPLLAELWEVEEVRIDDCDLTTVGLEHIAKLPNLKRLDVSWVRVTSLAPLARCAALEYLRVWPESGYDVGDVGTDGIEQLVNLRELQLRYEYGEHTFARLGALRKLKSLDIQLGEIPNANSFAALANLTELEDLYVEGAVPGGALQYLAPMKLLQKLALEVPTGGASDFEPLSSLSALSELHIQGDAFTDEALRHLAPVTSLCTLVAQETRVTPNGSRWLADLLPDVTVILNETVAKSPRDTITFCRRFAEHEDTVSAQLPVRWKYRRGRSTAEPALALEEDGWSRDHRQAYRGSVTPAQIRFYTLEGNNPNAVLNSVTEYGCAETQKGQTIEPLQLDELPNSAACISRIENVTHLVVALSGHDQCAVLECYATATRFEEFRALFLFVARSLRVGPDAQIGVGEEVTVPVSQL